MGKSAIKREAGYGRLCGDKGGLLTGPQSKENNWKWNWQNQGSVGVCLRKYILTTVSTTVPAKCVLIQRIKSYSMSLTMPSFLTCLFYFRLYESKVIANTCSENAAYKLDNWSIKSDILSGQHTVYCTRCGEKPVLLGSKCIAVRGRRHMCPLEPNDPILPIYPNELWWMQTIPCRPYNSLPSFPVEARRDFLTVFKPLTCEVWEVISTIPHLLCTVTWSLLGWVITPMHMPNVISPIYLHSINVQTRLKGDMQRFFTKLMTKQFLAAYCNINPSV